MDMKKGQTRDNIITIVVDIYVADRQFELAMFVQVVDQEREKFSCLHLKSKQISRETKLSTKR